MDININPKVDKGISGALNNRFKSIIASKYSETEQLKSFLADTVEFNDVIVCTPSGKPIYIFSRYQTINEEIITKYKPEFRTLGDYIYKPETLGEAEGKKKTLHEVLYKNGFKLLDRKFVCTRIAIPLIFAKDCYLQEELAVIKVKHAKKGTTYLIFITYFPSYSSAIIFFYFKQFLDLLDPNLIIDDEFGRML